MHMLLYVALSVTNGILAGQAPQNGVAKQIAQWWDNKEYSGYVKATTDKTVTISDWQKPTLLTTLPVYGKLAAGSVDASTGDPNSYRLQDLKAGDAVSLYTVVDNKVMYCASICIYERPGGLVPESQKPRKSRPWHEMQNLRNAERKDGKPIPMPEPPIPKYKQ